MRIEYEQTFDRLTKRYPPRCLVKRPAGATVIVMVHKVVEQPKDDNTPSNGDPEGDQEVQKDDT
jgi:hypothetical protein